MVNDHSINVIQTDASELLGCDDNKDRNLAKDGQTV